MTLCVAVYADWDGLPAPYRLGMLRVQHGAGREIFEFEFDSAAIANPAFANLHLDPRLGLFEGRQYPQQGSETFGVFADASPDRWGRMLIRRRLEREHRTEKLGKKNRVYESDYLLGVHDAFRSGALRFRLDDAGEFLDNQFGLAAPPLIRLRELEAASLAVERDKDNRAPEGDDLLRILLAPGGSLGGARPKANVEFPDGQLWIAKFPSDGDEHDCGAWELLVHTLARKCRLRVPESVAPNFAKSQHRTFLVKRFDRTPEGKRLHFASAMTLTGRKDGDDHSTGASYLDIARVLIDHGSQTDTDLHEMWSRIVFNVLVSNTDDHLRNHGFILVPNKGWRLSEAFDMNPAPGSQGLKLNINDAENEMDLDLVRSVAPHFRVNIPTANAIIENSQAVVQQWTIIADNLKISAREKEELALAFRLAG